MAEDSVAQLKELAELALVKADLVRESGRCGWMDIEFFVLSVGAISSALAEVLSEMKGEKEDEACERNRCAESCKDAG